MSLPLADRFLTDIAAANLNGQRHTGDTPGKLIIALLASTALVAVSALPATAGSAQWSPTAATSDFNTNNNWTPATVPTDTAFFVQSAITSLTLSQNTSLGALHFDTGAANYDLAMLGKSLNLTGAGIVFEGGSLLLHTNGGSLAFSNGATAGAATISNNGGFVTFLNTSTAGSAVIHNFNKGFVSFQGTSAGSATIDNANGGQIIFTGLADGGTASLSNAAGAGATAGTIDISGVTAAFNTLSVDSVSGGGLISLGSNALTVGNGNTTSQFDGVIQDGGAAGGTGGSLNKAGTGTFTLTGTNTYTGGTIITGGTLVAANSNALGTGPVTVFGATLAVNPDVSGGSNLSLANPIKVLGSATLQNLSGSYAPVFFTGGISGTGNVTFSAAPATTIGLTNTNTYTGSTTITFGTLVVVGGGIGAGAVPGSITASSQLINNGNLLIQSNGSATFSSTTNQGGIQNFFGGYFKDDLSNSGTFTNSGTFVGNIASNTGTFTNNSGASVTGNVNNAGTFVNNGTVTGTMTVTGGGTLTGTGVLSNLAFASGAIYLVTINGATATSTTVTGTATLAGTVSVNALTRLTSTTTFTILNAGAVSGTFATATSTNNFARNARLSYSGNSVFLTVDPGLLSPNLPGSANTNQKNVAAGIDAALTANSNTTLSAGLNTLFALSGSALPAALSQLSGESATASQQTTFDAMGQFMGLMTDPFMNRGGGAGSMPGAIGYADEANAYAAKSNRTDAFAMFTKAPIAKAYDPRWSAWVAGFGGSQNTSGDAIVGSNNTTSSVAGTAVGADYLFSPNTIAGFAIAGGGTSFSVAGSGSGRSDLFQFGGYMRHNAGPAYISAALAYGWQDITTNRTVTVAGFDQLRAEFNANAWSGRVEGGYRLVSPATFGVGITPYAAAQFVTFDLPSYAEAATAGTNAFALAYGARDVTDPRSEVGLRTDKSWMVDSGILTLRGRFAWAHDYDPNRSIAATFQGLPGSSFVVNGAAQAADSALTTASIEMKWRTGWSVAGTFEGEFSNVTSSYAGKGVVRYQW